MTASYRRRVDEAGITMRAVGLKTSQPLKLEYVVQVRLVRIIVTSWQYNEFTSICQESNTMILQSCRELYEEKTKK